MHEKWEEGSHIIVGSLTHDKEKLAALGLALKDDADVTK